MNEVPAQNPSPPQTQAPSTVIAVCLIVIASIMAAVALSYTKSVMIPFVFALFLSYFIAPIVDFFKTKLHFPHWAGVMSALATSSAIIASFILILRGSILRIVDGFYLYEEKLAYLSQEVASLAARLDIQLDQASLLARIKDLSVFTYLQGAAGTVMAFLFDFLLVVVFLIFLVSAHSKDEQKSSLREEIDFKIRKYILTKIATSLLTAFSVWIVFILFGLDLALMLSLLCFLLCFIPTLGSIIATLLPLPIALIQYEDRWPIIGVVLFPAFIQLLVGNIVEPKMLGKGLDLHPITILLSLMFWGLIWGIAGMFLAVPITAVMKIILDKIPIMHGFSRMLAGKSPI